MIIRAATHNDADEIGEMWLDLIAYHRQLDATIPAPTVDGEQRYAQRMRYGIDDTYFQIYVAADEDQLVGYVFGTIIDLLPEMFEEQRAGMIGDIYVRPAFRHRGVGKQLMSVMKDWFRLRNVSFYEWYVSSANASAIKFWEESMHGRAIMVRMRASLDDED